METNRDKPLRTEGRGPKMVPIPDYALELTLRIAKAREGFFKNQFVSPKLKAMASAAGRPDASPYVEGIIGYIGDIGAAEFLELDPIAELRRMLVETEFLRRRDRSDLVYKGYRIDVKTELVPPGLYDGIVKRSISDKAAYGMRLINKKQLDDNFVESDLYLFGTLDTGNPFTATAWTAVGFITSEERRRVAPVATSKPGVAWIPVPAYAIPTSALHDPNELFDLGTGPRPIVSALANLSSAEAMELSKLVAYLGFPT